MGNFHPLGVVGRGNETQLQVGEKYIIQFSGSRVHGLRRWSKIKTTLDADCFMR